MFFPMMVISIMMSLIMNSWLSLWMIMEINLISMIMLMLFDKLMKIELLMKYFLFQSFNSYIYLLNSLMMFIENFMNLSLLIMNFSMLIKMSIIPFHFWYIKIMYNMNWMNIFIMTTFNKIIPLFIINNIMNFINLKIFLLNFYLMFFSSFFSSLLGINQINLKLIMSYSSMIQLAWIIILLNFNEIMSMIYLMIYIFIMLNLTYLFYKLNLNNLIQLNMIKFNEFKLMMFMMFLLFSISSMPPMMGFLLKWIHIENMMNLNLSFNFMFLLILNSLISLFFYFRIMFSSLMNYNYCNKMNFKFINFNNKLNYKLLMINWLNFYLMIMYELF
uniref:NADH-ubiquinone oxidoreductase chain 2 n=1 Tax=Tetrastichus howardi TaxID=2848231 RepID=A0A8F5J7B1_9HYME|nr:NADH dehydrogenase subunit 2 [Tetrastichus howardi]QXM14781.1 NADH dehydrogenase subunit 2 [Tetrastichus howardi]